MNSPDSSRIDLDPLRDGTHRLTLRDGRRVFAKVRRDVPHDFFAAEARGLRALTRTGALRVPAVLAVEHDRIVLEDLGSAVPAARAWQRAGERLAALHRAPAARFGFDAHGYCGDSAQDNTLHDDGHEFFATCRLQPQTRRARDAALLDAHDAAAIDALATRLPRYLPPAPPVQVHGDLWLGNLHACGDGEIALIDGGAVHHGWAAADLAVTTLFGEPPREFFSAYESAAGVSGEWREYAPLLNLYHVLNHLNLFGPAYLAQVRAIVRRFA